MDISFLTEETTEKIPVDSFTDEKKMSEIVNKLCEKRKILESKIANHNDINNENTLALLELIEDMGTFGIKEVDYQIFKAKETTEQQSLF